MKCAWAQIGWPGPGGPRARVGTGARAKAGAVGKFHCRDQQQTEIKGSFWPFVIDVGVEALGTADTTDVLAAFCVFLVCFRGGLGSRG